MWISRGHFEACAGGKQRTGEVHWDAVDVVLQQRNETEIAVGDQRQRPKKVLAILAVANPRLALLIALERKRVNQHGPAPGELDIVGAAVLQDHAMRQRQFLNTEGRQGGVFELAKTPFVRIGDKRHPVRLQDFVCLWRSRMMKLCFLVPRPAGPPQPICRRVPTA